jgi:hypothetical protein
VVELSIVADPLNVLISGQSFKKRVCLLAQMNTDISYRVSEVALVKLLVGPVSGWGGFQRFSRTRLYTQIQKTVTVTETYLTLGSSSNGPGRRLDFSKNQGDWDIASPYIFYKIRRLNRNDKS